MKIFNSMSLCFVNYYNNILIRFKNIVYKYHSSKILLIKKNIKQWGIIPKILFKTMSDNMHYVNLISNQTINGLKVGSCSYFSELLRKITRWGGMFEGASTQLSKNTKTLTFQRIWEKKTKKGVNIYFGLCKLMGVKYESA
jgi:hypothetical protein